METVLIVCLVGFIAYIAGRAQIGTNLLTIEQARLIAQDLYDKGRNVGREEAIRAVNWEAEEHKASINAVALIDEYINGYAFAMKAVRKHGNQAEAAMKEHMAEVLLAREEAILANPDHRSVLHI